MHDVNFEWGCISCIYPSCDLPREEVKLGFPSAIKRCQYEWYSLLSLSAAEPFVPPVEETLQHSTCKFEIGALQTLNISPRQGAIVCGKAANHSKRALDLWNAVDSCCSFS
eukprot:6214208-Pleurochrysis_carterae.AAC.6